MDKFCLLKAKPRQPPAVISFPGVGRQLFGESLVDAIVEWTKCLEAEDAMENLQDKEIVAGIVQQRTDTFPDIIHIRCNLWWELNSDEFVIKPYPEMAHQFSGRRSPLKTPAPLLGEHK